MTGFLAMVMCAAAGCNLPDPRQIPGKGIERPVRYEQAVLTERDLLMAFAVGYCTRAWGKIAIADLAWYGPDDQTGWARSKPSFADDMDEFAQEAAGRSRLPILEMPLFKPETDDRRLLADVATRLGTCLVQRGDTVILVRAPETPLGSPQFAAIRAPERPYKRWWSDPLYIATLPARLLAVGGFLLGVALFGMH